eukprot:732370_1
MAQRKVHKRSEIVDNRRESKLLSTVIKLALEPNEKGWTIDPTYSSVQAKTDPITKQPIARSINANKSNATFKQIYDYFKRGYQQERDILYHIDDDHHIQYYTVNQPSALVSDRDYQYMCVRHSTTITDQSQNGSFKVIVLLRYDILDSHPLYRPPPDKCIRGKMQCSAWVCYTRDSAEETDFVCVCISFTQDWGGTIPQSNVNSLTPSYASEMADDFHKGCEVIPKILQSRKDQKYKQMDAIRMTNDNVLREKKNDDNNDEKEEKKSENNEKKLSIERIDNPSHPMIDNANVMDTMGRRGDDLCLSVFNQLITMGFDETSARIASQTTNDIRTAITIASAASMNAQHKTPQQHDLLQNKQMNSTTTIGKSVDNESHAMIDNANVLDTMGKSDASLSVCHQLIAMGFDEESAKIASQTTNDIGIAITIASGISTKAQQKTPQQHDVLHNKPMNSKTTSGNGSDNESHAMIDNPNVMDTMGKSDASLSVCHQLIAMGFDEESARIASHTTNDINTAITIASKASVNVQQIKKSAPLSAQQYRTKQFETFLKRNDLENYTNKFQEHKCCDLEFVDMFDDDLLQNEIGINNKLLRKRFLKKCEKMKTDMDRFQNEYGISALLMERLSDYGLVTIKILCEEIKKESDLKDKYKI